MTSTQDGWGAEGISGRVKFLPLAWAGMPKTSFRKNSNSPLYYGIAIFVVFLLLWNIISGYTKPLFLPSRFEVLKAFGDMLWNQSLISHLWASTWRVFIGFSIATLVAVPIGLLIGTYAPVAAAFSPLNDFLRYMPVVAFIPLCILWAGVGHGEKILVIFLGTVFQLIPMVADTASGVPRVYVETAATLGLKNQQIFKRIVWPAVQPQVIDHLRALKIRETER